MDENVVWIGPLGSQYVQGAENVREILSIEQEIPFVVTNAHYSPVSYTHLDVYKRQLIP